MDQKKRELIEWERNFQSNSDSFGKGSDKKKELLSKLWTEQRAMSADINSRLLRRDIDRKNILDNVTQLETHSKQLLNSLYNWEERHKNQMELLEREECQLLDLMLKYDHKVDLKKNAILIAMQEMLTKESQRLALSDELKEYNSSEIRNKINEQEQLQRQAFEALQRTRDYRNQSITNQILLIENELTELSRAEMQKRDDRSDCILSDIRCQRAKLAQLLAQLLKQKKEREVQLREQLHQMERRRVQVDDQDFWLVQYQCLLQRQPIEAQIRQFGIDEDIGRVLTAVHKEYERIVDYLSIFADMTFDRLNAMGDKDLLRLGIDDYELCKLIRDKLDEHANNLTGAASSSHSPEEHTPTAPISEENTPTASEPQVLESISEATSLMITELSAQLSAVRLWRLTECVVCLDTTCDVVFLPCGHVCTCQPCSHAIQSCPMCRMAIDIKQCLNA